MVEAGEIVGITTNPTIFAKAIGAGGGYEEQLRDLALRGTAIGETLRLLAAWDVRAACDVLRPVFERSDGRDGRVSIEVDPRISGDAARTVAEARGLWWLVDRANLFVKIPATSAGLPAIAASLADGISVNVTLIFSLHPGSHHRRRRSRQCGHAGPSCRESGWRPEARPNERRGGVPPLQ